MAIVLVWTESVSCPMQHQWAGGADVLHEPCSVCLDEDFIDQVMVELTVTTEWVDYFPRGDEKPLWQSVLPIERP